MSRPQSALAMIAILLASLAPEPRPAALPLVHPNPK